MKIVPITLRAANAYVTERHRHHKSSRGHKFSIGLMVDEEIVGIAICVDLYHEDLMMVIRLK